MMDVRRSFTPATIVLIAALCVSAGCARSPEAKKARHLQRGDKYAQKEQYRDAIFEYRHVLRYEKANPQAIRQIGLIQAT